MFPLEQENLWNQINVLNDLLYVYNTEIYDIEFTLNTIVSLIPQEQDYLNSVIADLTNQYDALNIQYQDALATEDVLMQDRAVLVADLNNLNTLNTGYSNDITNNQILLADLQVQENVLQADLSGILLQKQTDRMDLGGLQLNDQIFEADLLMASQDVMFLQGDYQKSNTILGFRNNLGTYTNQLNQLQTGLAAITAQQESLKTQLQQSQQFGTGPANIKIRATGTLSDYANAGGSQLTFGVSVCRSPGEWPWRGSGTVGRPGRGTRILHLPGSFDI